MRHSLRFAFLGALLLGGACSDGSRSSSEGVTVESVSEISPSSAGYSLGVSAPYSGVSGGAVLISGGANFPEVSAADGGVKAYYDQIFALLESGDWAEVGRMDSPRAYGATVRVGDWLYFIGGADALGSISDVVGYSFSQGKLSRKEIPSLPRSIEQGGATIMDSVIYLTGGLSAGVANRSIYTLDLRSPQRWDSLECKLPVSMIQPVVVALAGDIYIWGGFTPSSDSTAGVTIDYGYKFSPSNSQWQKIQSYKKDGIAQSMVGSSGVAYQDSCIIVTGGVDKLIFDQALERAFQIATNRTCELNKLKEIQRQYMLEDPLYYKFNSQVMLYNVNTNEWKELLNEPRSARAGAALVLKENELYILNGELKPGIRTPQNTKIKL
ncbi:MAG: cyclically-permuted mutarotase family protein [Rikenellaceae bacterium]